MDKMNSKALKPYLSVLDIFQNKNVLSIISMIIFLLLWDFIVVRGIAGSYLPRPIEVFDRFLYILKNPLAGKTLVGHLLISLKRVFIAFIIAVIFGIPIGVLMGFNQYARAIMKPVFDLFKPMPPIAWISLAILWFGIGETSKVFIIFIGSFVPIVVNSYNGIRLVEPELYDAIRILGADYWQEHLEVTFPGSFPAIFAGMQISLSIGWTCVLAAELVGAREGIGFIIVMGMNVGNVAQIIVGMLVIAAVAFLLSVGLNYLERKVCPWKKQIET
ncbi:MAG: ABC transporter permease [Candidatus Atribacteria bacterium]|nr:ABC transporter permease [Candidatus Atribacteria bacterium]